MTDTRLLSDAGNEELFKQLPHSLALVQDLQNHSNHKSKVITALPFLCYSLQLGMLSFRISGVVNCLYTPFLCMAGNNPLFLRTLSIIAAELIGPQKLCFRLTTS